MRKQIILLSGVLVVLLAAWLLLRGTNEELAGITVQPPATEKAATAAERVNELADKYVQFYFEQFPEQALLWGAVDPDPARLTDNSLESQARWQILQQDLLAKLDEIDPSAITDPAAVITAKMLRNQLQSALDLALCRNELWSVSPTWIGWLAEFTTLAGKLKLDTPEQREAALSRMQQMATYIDTEVENLHEGVELGYVAPKNSVRALTEVLDAFLALPLTETPFAIAVQQQEPGYQQRVTEVVRDTILPAMQRYRDYLAAEYQTAARDSMGVYDSPGGEACYRASVRYWVTVDLDAGEIHRIGLEQMDRILAEIREIGERSFGENDPVRLLQLIKTDPQYLFKSRAEMVAYAESALTRAEAAMPQWFGRLPKAPVVVEPYPAFQEKSAPGGQAEPAAGDGSSPGKLLINTYQAEKQSRAALEAITFHEAYPGHLTQLAIAQERADLHPISRYFYLSGFGEGWALYSERLADEMGLYSSDLDRLGMLSNEAWRAARLVVDSGLHGMGWSREQALDYMDAHNANTHALNAAEVDRYIAVPGQATSYLLGALEIWRLRDWAEVKLGDNFDIRLFHDRVLEDGAVPLGQLEQKIRHWVDAGGG